VRPKSLKRTLTGIDRISRFRQADEIPLHENWPPILTLERERRGDERSLSLSPQHGKGGRGERRRRAWQYFARPAEMRLEKTFPLRLGNGKKTLRYPWAIREQPQSRRRFPRRRMGRGGTLEIGFCSVDYHQREGMRGLFCQLTSSGNFAKSILSSVRRERRARWMDPPRFICLSLMLAFIRSSGKEVRALPSPSPLRVCK